MNRRDQSTTSSWFTLSVTDSVTLPTVWDIGPSSNHTTAQSGLLLDHDKQRIIIIAILLALTLLGNLTLILVLLYKRSRRVKRVNILLMNLACGDLAVAMFVNSTEILFLAFGDWPLGPAVCKLSVYVQMVCLSSATNLLTAMSIDRYQVIVKPMQSLAKRPRIWLKITIAWALSLIFPLPQLFIFVQYNHGWKHDGTPRRMCGSRGYTAAWQRKVYFTYTTAYILVVPMLLMLYCYAHIIRVVWIRARHESRGRPSCLVPRTADTTRDHSTDTSYGSQDVGVSYGCAGLIRMAASFRSSQTIPLSRKSTKIHRVVEWAPGHNSRDISDEDLNTGSPRMSVRRGLVTASKRRAVVMTLTVVMSFLVCHTPYFVVTIVRIYSDYQWKLERAMFVSEFLVMVHSTLNPILYGLFTLRHYHIKHILSLLICSSHPQRQRQQQGHGLRQLSHDRTQMLTNIQATPHASNNITATTGTASSATSNINSSSNNNNSNNNNNNSNNINSSRQPKTLSSCQTMRTTSHLWADQSKGQKATPTLHQTVCRPNQATPTLHQAACKPNQATSTLYQSALMPTQARSRADCMNTLKSGLHQSEPALLSNTEVVCLNDQQLTTVVHSDWRDARLPVSTSPDLFSPYSFVKSCRMFRHNGFVSPCRQTFTTDHTNRGSDTMLSSRFPEMTQKSVYNRNIVPPVEDTRKSSPRQATELLTADIAL